MKAVEAPDEMDALYASGNESPPAEAEDQGEQTEPAAEESAESVDEQEAAGDTAVVDNKVLSPSGKLKEGDTITLVVVKNYGEESEVKLASEQSGKPGSMGNMESDMAELDMMDKEA